MVKHKIINMILLCFFGSLNSMTRDQETDTPSEAVASSEVPTPEPAQEEITVKFIGVGGPSELFPPTLIKQGETPERAFHEIMNHLSACSGKWPEEISFVQGTEKVTKASELIIPQDSTEMKLTVVLSELTPAEILVKVFEGIDLHAGSHQEVKYWNDTLTIHVVTPPVPRNMPALSLENIESHLSNNVWAMCADIPESSPSRAVSAYFDSPVFFIPKAYRTPPNILSVLGLHKRIEKSRLPGVDYTALLCEWYRANADKIILKECHKMPCDPALRSSHFLSNYNYPKSKVEYSVVQIEVGGEDNIEIEIIATANATEIPQGNLTEDGFMFLMNSYRDMIEVFSQEADRRKHITIRKVRLKGGIRLTITNEIKRSDIQQKYREHDELSHAFLCAMQLADEISRR